MRIAIIADIHANAIALDAVLTGIDASGGVDEVWFTGDVADMGSDPATCISRLMALPALTAVRGNGDREVAAPDLGAQAAMIQSADPDEARLLLGYVEEAAWSRGTLSAAQLDWLAELPLQARATLPDGTRVLLVHASPGTDEGTGVRLEQTDEEVSDLLAGADTDLLIVGHTHAPLDRTVRGMRIINPGSVSNPVTEDQRAMWLLLEADRDGYRFERRYAHYDQEAYLESLTTVRHPAEAMIRLFFDRPAAHRQ